MPGLANFKQKELDTKYVRLLQSSPVPACKPYVTPDGPYGPCEVHVQPDAYRDWTTCKQGTLQHCSLTRCNREQALNPRTQEQWHDSRYCETRLHAVVGEYLSMINADSNQDLLHMFWFECMHMQFCTAFYAFNS